MKLSLVVAEGNPVGKEIPVRQSQFLIGRDPECQLRPASPLVSKRHCAIVVRDEKVFVRDFGSTNGTLINNQPVKGEIEVSDGDILKFGPLAFQIKAVPEPQGLSSADTVSDAAQASLADTGTLQKARDAGTSDTQPAATIVSEKSRSAEDDVADLLFKLDGDSSPAVAIPGGTTVMHALPPEEEQKIEETAVAAAAEATPEKPKSNRSKPQDMKATSDAAKAILDKYMRRPRT